MDTPICNFVRRYSESNALRLHMPGHKGQSLLGMEELDITEISGADSLYEANGIIKESEENASSLFGCKTFYSTEGSSLCIRAMLYLAVLYSKQQNKNPLILAGRNAHKTFLSAAALLDFDIEWLYPKRSESYLSCNITAKELELAIKKHCPTAVYLTSPDYLGNVADIRALSEVCRNNGVLLIVDNAHGAYLKFLPESNHPIDLGADICCDSAHKTLPVLTGGAYLHISPHAPEIFIKNAKDALALFGSTSPSYIIMQSLDAANKYISDGYKDKLTVFTERIKELKTALTAHGYCFLGNEPLKLTINTKKYGYYGFEFADMLHQKGLVCEFCDPDFAVMMLTPETEVNGLEKIKRILISIPKKEEITDKPPIPRIAETAVSVRKACFSESETVPTTESIGRVLSTANIACPPAVPIVVCGERIDADAVRCFEYYGIKECKVIK
ncbi:MAG: PLP-dependent transferase [Clostridia bacterium]|nr:PLP-dependent transferase [Clostridia bacterium]